MNWRKVSVTTKGSLEREGGPCGRQKNAVWLKAPTHPASVNRIRGLSSPRAGISSVSCSPWQALCNANNRCSVDICQKNIRPVNPRCFLALTGGTPLSVFPTPIASSLSCRMPCSHQGPAWSLAGKLCVRRQGRQAGGKVRPACS